MRNSWVLFTLFAIVALSSALNLEALNIDGINAYLHHGERRQAQGTGASSSPSPTPSSDPTSSPSEAPSSTPSEAPSSDEPQSTPPSTPPLSSPSQQPSSSPNRSPSSAAASSTPPPASSSSKLTTPITRTSALVTTELQPVTTVITLVSGSQTLLSTDIGTRTTVRTTGTAVSTELPSTQKGDGGSSGLSDTNKKVIGGVVGGVGGAILLGAIAVVFWRMRSRKSRVTDDDADLMAGTGAALGDKTHNGPSPFQSNLEQYHNPGGRPNAAANF